MPHCQKCTEPRSTRLCNTDPDRSHTMTPLWSPTPLLKQDRSYPKTTAGAAEPRHDVAHPSFLFWPRLHVTRRQHSENYWGICNQTVKVHVGSFVPCRRSPMWIDNQLLLGREARSRLRPRSKTEHPATLNPRAIQTCRGATYLCGDGGERPDGGCTVSEKLKGFGFGVKGSYAQV